MHFSCHLWWLLSYLSWISSLQVAVSANHSHRKTGYVFLTFPLICISLLFDRICIFYIFYIFYIFCIWSILCYFYLDNRLHPYLMAFERLSILWTHWLFSPSGPLEISKPKVCLLTQYEYIYISPSPLRAVILVGKVLPSVLFFPGSLLWTTDCNLSVIESPRVTLSVLPYLLIQWLSFHFLWCREKRGHRCRNSYQAQAWKWHVLPILLLSQVFHSSFLYCLHTQICRFYAKPDGSTSISCLSTRA